MVMKFSDFLKYSVSKKLGTEYLFERILANKHFFSIFSKLVCSWVCFKATLK